jgi:beta-xylosidase
MLLPLLRRGTGVLALAAAFFACETEPTTLSAPDPIDPTTPLPGASVQPVAFAHDNNPVYPSDFPDPFVLVADSAYYAFSTNSSSAVHVPVLRSTDLATWESLGDALPELPQWAVAGRRLTWAPAVLKIEGRYVLLYTTRDAVSGLQCIGRAESPTPAGPFVDNSSAPFICQTDRGGSIDASFVSDSSGVFVLWKNDGNCCAKTVTIWSQRLTPDGRTLLGTPSALLHRDRSWEGPLVEAPTMWEEKGRWHLLYSANMWNTDRYATGYATCDSPTGPCRKVGVGPVLVSDTEMSGPGGAEVFMDLTGQRWVAYHGWTATQVGYVAGGARSFRLDRVTLSSAALE